MRPGQSNKRSRGRGRKGPSPLSRGYESNGPDVKIRGTAQHIADKYINLARDAQSSGDTVLHQAYMQHAEHFYRIVALAQQQMNQPINVRRADDPIDTADSNDDDEREGFDPADPDAPQPDVRGQNQANGRDRDRNDDDGERRGRRNRGRGRRGRDDGRDEARAADSDQERGSRDGRTEKANGSAEHEKNGAADNNQPSQNGNEASDPAATVEQDGRSEAAASHAEPNGEQAERPRRAPRSRKASVDVSDRFDEPGSSETSTEQPAAEVAATSDVPVQASSDEK
ncbi:MAG: DUF4167 domain-containing protein [Pseudomonadota bacterium]